MDYFSAWLKHKFIMLLYTCGTYFFIMVLWKALSMVFHTVRVYTLSDTIMAILGAIVLSNYLLITPYSREEVEIGDV